MRSGLPIRFILPVLIAVIAGLMPVTVQAKRLAFVVGIDNYANLDAGAQLKRAVNDARGVAQALRKLRFNVTTLENARRSTFKTAWQQFLGAIEPGDEVAFFFSGHGAEIEEQNFLIPSDIPKMSYDPAGADRARVLQSLGIAARTAQPQTKSEPHRP